MTWESLSGPAIPSPVSFDTAPKALGKIPGPVAQVIGLLADCRSKATLSPSRQLFLYLQLAEVIAPRVLHLALCGSSVSLEKLQGGFLQESPSNSTTLMSTSRSILADIADAVREDHASIAGSFMRLVDDAKSAFSEKLIYHSRPVNYLLGSPVHSICRRLENTQPPCLYMRSLFDKFHAETLHHVNYCVHYKQELKSPLTKTHALDQLVAIAISNTWVTLLQFFREEIDVDQLTQVELIKGFPKHLHNKFKVRVYPHPKGKPPFFLMVATTFRGVSSWRTSAL